MDFNIRLENLIEEKNVSQKQLAIDLHVSKSTINGYITGYREPDFEMLVRLATYLDSSTDYLLGLSNEKKPAPSKLDADEAELIRLYRTLIPKHKNLVMGQVKFFHGHPDDE